MLHFLHTAYREKWAGRRTAEQIRAVGRQRLRRLVAWAKTHSPFHAARLRDVDPDQLDPAQLPVLTKTEMMEHFDDLVTDRRLRRADLEQFTADPARLGQWFLGRYAPSRTSGTQGMQALIVQDRSMMELLYAIQMTRGTAFTTSPAGTLCRFLRPARLAAVTIGRGFYPSAAVLAYMPPAVRHFVNRLWLTRIDPLEPVVGQLNRFQPQVLLAYASVLEILAREALARRLRLGRRDPLRQVINMSEPLSDAAKRLIAEAFGIPVTDNYAAGECMALTVGCPQGHGMHLNADWAILEVVDSDNRPVPPGRPGNKVLLTNLYNTVQPFLRYELNDVVTMSPTPCPCGSPLPLVRKVEGRTDEVVWIRDGDRFREVHPYVFVDALDDCPPVGWYQVVQEERNRFRLRAAPAPQRHVSAEELRAVLESGLRRFGLAGLVDFDIEITPDLAPDSKTGKLKRVTSRVGPPETVADGEEVAAVAR